MRLGPTTVQHIARSGAGTTDRYNTPELAAADPVTVNYCRLDVTSSEEFLENRDTVVSRGILFAPYIIPDPDNPGETTTLNVGVLDSFTIDGATWDVDGNPDLTPSHRGPHHYEIPVIHYHH